MGYSVQLSFSWQGSWGRGWDNGKRGANVELHSSNVPHKHVARQWFRIMMSFSID